MMRKDIPTWSIILEFLEENEYRFKRTDIKKGWLYENIRCGLECGHSWGQ